MTSPFFARRNGSVSSQATTSPKAPTRLLVLLLFALLITAFAARKSLYNVYAYNKIWHRSKFKVWPKFPFEDNIYVGLRDLSKSSSGAWENQSLEDACYPPRPQYRNAVQSAGGGSFGSVACEGVGSGEIGLNKVGRLKALNGSLSHFPHPSLGSYDLMDLESNKLHTRFGRFSQYGLGQDGPQPVDWDRVNWAELQNRCVERNAARLDIPPGPALNASTNAVQQPERCAELSGDVAETVNFCAETPRRPRTAVVMRAYDAFAWTHDDMYNVRAMLSELSLYSGGEYHIYVIVQIHNTSEALPVDPARYQELKRRYVPKELLNITELWTETECEIAYPRVGEYDVYHHTFMPLQLFAVKHPEFDFYWNWEMDVRYTGHYYKLFEHLAAWTKNQTRNDVWERNARFYIPAVHGSYEDFARRVTLLSRYSSQDPDPNWGVGEEADLITLFPLFDPKGTMWPYKNHLINYDAQDTAKPRRVSIITASRFSRRLLMTMHQENTAGHAMMSEMWPGSVALQHGLKAVYAPHPVFLDRRWPPDQLEAVFNAGRDGQVGGSLDTVMNQEHNFDGSSWWWNAPFPGDLYQRWMGRALEGPGSPEWEEEHGPMCLPGILLHPVKASRLNLE